MIVLCSSDYRLWTSLNIFKILIHDFNTQTEHNYNYTLWTVTLMRPLVQFVCTIFYDNKSNLIIFTHIWKVQLKQLYDIVTLSIY